MMQPFPLTQRQRDGGPKRGAPFAHDDPTNALRTPPSAQLLPERALLLAVLESAKHDLRLPAAVRHPRATDLRGEARRWVEGAHAKITFADLCDLLGLDPDAVRAVLLAPEP